MNKREWNKERILWKANQFNSLSQELKNKNDNFLGRLCEKYMDPDDEILLSFFDKDDNRWTVITMDRIISYHDNNLHQVKLDAINKLIDIKKEGILDKDLKCSSDFLLVGDAKLPIWAPNSQILFALMNILRMFPLKENV